MDRKLKMGMVGGGPGAFIGAVHRMVAVLDNRVELVCGAFSSSAEKSKQTGKELFLAPDRVYDSYNEMFEKEAVLPVGERMDFVSIVAPNHVHFQVAMAALNHGFNVVCEKPVTFTLDEALKLRDKINEVGVVFCLTHNYTGYPMVKQAREIVQSGGIGEVVKIISEYPQGWLTAFAHDSNQDIAIWRTDPKVAGVSCCMGDIGSHAENLTNYITGLRITEMCADLTTFTKGIQLEDDGNVLLRYDNGARGIVYASQISVGEENNLNIRVYGTLGGIEWHQQEPNTLIVKHIGRPTEMLRTNCVGVGDAANYNSRTPAGHTEGYLEAFANVYRNFADTLIAKLDGCEPHPLAKDFPTIDDGVYGMAFIESCVASSQSEEKWYKFPQI